MMRENNEIELLQRIARVKAPESIRTEVEKRIMGNNDRDSSVHSALAIAASVAVLVMLNLYILTASIRSAPDDQTIGSSVVAEMNLTTSNQLYHD